MPGPSRTARPEFDLADNLPASSVPLVRSRVGRGERIAAGVAVPALLIACWWLASTSGALPVRLFPPPGDVLRSGRDFFLGDSQAPVPGVVPFAGAAGQHIRASISRWAVAYTLAVCIGLPLGLGLGLSRWVSAALDPLFQGLRSVPITAWLPIALVWFGLGEGAARFLVFVGAVSPIVVATADASARVPRQLVDSARMLGTPTVALARRVYVPAALPGIATGLRLGLTLGWMSVIVGELTGTSRGLGAMMFAAREVGRLDQILVGMFAFAVIGLCGDLLLRALTRRFTAWADR